MPDIARPGTHRSPARGQYRRGGGAVPDSTLTVGRFGRLFRNLPAHTPGDAELEALAARMAGDEPSGDTDEMPAGITYLGQFIDHDLTFDPASSLERQNDPDALVNFRTPGYDLDSVYGRGPADQPYLYQRTDPDKLLLGARAEPPVLGDPESGPRPEDDLPRNPEEVALIGDPRNDENIIVGQLHLVFLKLHNRLVDALRGGELDDARRADATIFEDAQRLARWHYQWVVLEEFLPTICDTEVLNGLVSREPISRELTCRTLDPRVYRYAVRPFIPVEWSVAAYRFGHSLIRPSYHLNATLRTFRGGTPVDIFIEDPDSAPLEHLGGGRELPAFWTIDWRMFFRYRGDDADLQLARRIDTKLADGLRFLPGFPDAARALTLRNLQRGRAMGLPSGQAVARRLGTEPLSRRELGIEGEAPLWFYILREADVQGSGQHLGHVGSTIVAETMLGLLAADPCSFIRTDPTWEPVLPLYGGGRPHDWGMSDLIAYASPIDGRHLEPPRVEAPA